MKTSVGVSHNIMTQQEMKNQAFTLYDVMGTRHFTKPVFLTINYEYINETSRKSWMHIKNLSLAKALVKYGTWEYKPGTLKTMNTTPDAEYMSVELYEPRILEKEKVPIKYNDRQYFEENAIILSDNKQMQTNLEEEYDCIM